MSVLLVCGGLVIIDMDRVVDISKVIEISGTDTDDNKLIWMLHFILMLHINNVISNYSRKWIKHVLQHRYTIPNDIPNINYDNFRFFWINVWVSLPPSLVKNSLLYQVGLDMCRFPSDWDYFLTICVHSQVFVGSSPITPVLIHWYCC